MLSEFTTWVRESVDGITLVLVNAPTPDAATTTGEWNSAIVGVAAALVGALAGALVTSRTQRRTTDAQIKSTKENVELQARLQRELHNEQLTRQKESEEQ